MALEECEAVVVVVLGGRERRGGGVQVRGRVGRELGVCFNANIKTTSCSSLIDEADLVYNHFISYKTD